MKRINSQVNTQDAAFKENDRLNRQRTEELATLLGRIRSGGSARPANGTCPRAR